jgi:hypothetical protein
LLGLFRRQDGIGHGGLAHGMGGPINPPSACGFRRPTAAGSRPAGLRHGSAAGMQGLRTTA